MNRLQLGDGLQLDNQLVLNHKIQTVATIQVDGLVTHGQGWSPAAVVTGYGDHVDDVNYSEAFELHLVELASGAVLQTLNSEVHAGRAIVLALPIRKSGAYRLELIVRGAMADTWDFSVKREDSPGSAPETDPPASYAKGNFSVGMENFLMLNAFKDYDNSLLWSLNVAVYKESKRANREDFAQMPAGMVVIQFDLSATGQVTSPEIIANSLSDNIGRFFLRALQNGGPYKPWPAEARAALGSETRRLKVTFRYD